MRRALCLWLCWSTGLLSQVAGVPLGHAQEAVALHCARGNVEDYPDAKLILNEEGPRVVDVTFVGYRPSPVRADWSLRDCLRTAIKYDDSQDIVAHLWYREPRLRSPRKPFAPYGGSRTLMYRASSGKIVVR
jgi:hypothetical protein